MKFILPNHTDTGSLFISFLTLHRSIGYLFFLETIALVAFGISWMTKGGVIFGDKQVPA